MVEVGYNWGVQESKIYQQENQPWDEGDVERKVWVGSCGIGWGMERGRK